MRARRSTALALFGALVLLGALVSASPSTAQPQPPVHVTVESLFGEGTLLSEAYAPVVVTLESRTSRDLQGELELAVEGRPGTRHVAHVDLPAGALRQVVMTLFADGDGGGLTARYRVDGREAGRGGASYTSTSGGRSVVVMGEPPRLRGALLDLDVEEHFASGPRQLRAAVGVVRFDAASGDPMLPTEAVGWSSVRLLVASAPVLARASEAQRAALLDWLRVGGRLLVLPRTSADLAEPWLRRWAGPVEVGPPGESAPALVPSAGERFSLGCGEAQRVESFGCSAPVGFGRIYLASYDAASPSAIDSGVSRELVRSVYAARELAEPRYGFGRHRETLSGELYHYPGALPGIGSVRAALDPNESFRPALVLVALALLLYVIVVGPLNFRWVQRRNQPALALVTTPLAALGCVAVLLLVGYVGKGVTTRFRRFELVEAVEGERRAPARRYTGLYMTRPGSFELPSTPAGEAAHRVEGGGARGPEHRHHGGRVQLADFRAGLWETVFLREDRLVELRGTVRFERDGRRLAEVVNELSEPLRHAFVVEESGSVYVIGDLPPGGRASIPRTVTSTVPAWSYREGARSLATPLGLGGEHVRALAGLVATFALHTGSATTEPVLPALYAYVPIDSATLAERFSSEADERWIRIVPRLRGEPVAPAAPPLDPQAYPQREDETAGEETGEAAASEPPAEVTL